MNDYKNFDSIQAYAYNIGLAVVVLGFILLVLYLVDKLANRAKTRLMGYRFRNLKIFDIEIINVGKQQLIVTTVIHSLQWMVSLLFLYFSLVVILSRIPSTQGIAETLVDWIFEPLKALLDGLIGYLPDLFSIIITLLVARYLIKAVRYIATGVRRGSFRFPGFHPRTAPMTAGIIIFLIYTLAVILIFPSLPGYESLAFKGIATFLGALITIGGSSVIANYMAGIVITYMHAFEKGDWVEINGLSGQVMEIGSFAISLRSYKKETVKIPNSKVLGAAIINYSEQGGDHFVIHTEISIGYDVHWKTVNQLLIDAVRLTEGLDDPHTHYKKLDDFYVVYEINASLNDPSRQFQAYSMLHRNMLDVFNEAGIEIMSPHYRAERDGSASTVSKMPVDSTTT